ncbi:MAG: hypothetical protein ACREBW_06835 [Candidatus Micrarchaeaceae archaeon]
MHRLLAIICAGLLTFSGVAFAQSSPNNQNSSQHAANGQQSSSEDGLTALDQVPPSNTNDYTGLLVGGLAIGGAITAIVISNNNNNNSSPASP